MCGEEFEMTAAEPHFDPAAALHRFRGDSGPGRSRHIESWRPTPLAPWSRERQGARFDRRRSRRAWPRDLPEKRPAHGMRDARAVLGKGRSDRPTRKIYAIDMKL
jgi:hypothetical protein